MDNGIITYNLNKKFSQIKAFTSSRQTMSGGANVRYTQKSEKNAQENIIRLARALDLDARQLVFPVQTHSSSVARISGITIEGLQNTDAIITDKSGVCLCVQTADCVPLLLFDPVKNVIAAVHAGWRGTVGLIVKEVVQQFQYHYSSSGANIMVIVGPSIGPDVYEVGDEVVTAVKQSIPNPDKSLKKYPSGKFHLNLWEANRQILLECGVLPQHIEISGYCTYSNEEQFFSARREGIETGRLVSGIMLLKV